MPAIIAGEGTGIMDTLSRLRAIVRQAPGRIVTYWVMTALLIAILGLVLVTLMSLATTQTQLLSAFTAFGPSPSGLVDPFGAGPMGLLVGPLLRLLDPVGGGGPAVYIAALLYVLAGLLLIAVVVAIPYFIFPMTCACAAHISVTGGAPAAAPAPQPAPAQPPAQAPAVQPTPAQVPAQQPAPAATPAAQPTPVPPAAQAPAPPAPAATRYCSNCGGPLRPSARFCGQCGGPAT